MSTSEMIQSIAHSPHAMRLLAEQKPRPPILTILPKSQSPPTTRLWAQRTPRFQLTLGGLREAHCPPAVRHLPKQTPRTAAAGPLLPPTCRPRMGSPPMGAHQTRAPKVQPPPFLGQALHPRLLSLPIDLRPHPVLRQRSDSLVTHAPPPDGCNLLSAPRPSSAGDGPLAHLRRTDDS